MYVSLFYLGWFYNCFLKCYIKILL
jgi:hypothetical protein